MTDFRDIVEGASISRTHDSYEAIRVFRFNDLSGNPSSRCRTALERPSTPKIGDPHPDIVGIVCLSVEARALDTKIAEVTATYSIPQAEQQDPDDGAKGTLEVGASVQQTQTQKDVNGDVMLVEWVPDVAIVNNSTASLPRKKQGGKIDIQIPQPVLRVTRRERLAPWEKALRFVGKINRLRWNDGDSKTWLCVNINGITNDGGLSYEVSHEFQYNVDTWDAEVTYEDPETGRPAGDAEEQLAIGIPTIKTFQVYPDVDFSPLRIRF